MRSKICGLLIPVFSMRREQDHGIGDTAALMEWIDWAFDHCVGFLQLLPVNVLGNDSEPSPYSSISSVALEPLYLTLAPEWIPGIEEPVECPGEALVGENPDLVDYQRVRTRKKSILKAAFERFLSQERYASARLEFQGWVEEQDNWLKDFVDFNVVAQHFGTDIWWQWPEQDIKKVRSLAAEQPEARNFEEWMQWLCDVQWRRVRRHADMRGVKLMGDIPIGLSMASADVFFEREIFDLNWSGGAPAEGDFAEDPFTAKWGQNWGIPLYKWDVMEKKDDFAWWRRRVRHTTRIFQMYRIDHILGFYRIYAFPWKPTENAEFLNLSMEAAAAKTGGLLPQFKPRPDWSNEDREANLNEGHKYLSILLETCPEVEVVGEDLGCVPDYVRPDMRKLNIPGFKIPHWEIMENGEILMGEQYNECSFATYATHDFPPISVTWNEIYARVLPGRAAEAQIERQARESRWGEGERWHHRQNKQPDIENMHNALRSLYWFADYCKVPRTSAEVPWNPMCKTALFYALFACNSRFVALMFTDLFDLSERINSPGTLGGSNWRVRAPFTAKQASEMMQSTWIRRLLIQTERNSAALIRPLHGMKF